MTQSNQLHFLHTLKTLLSHFKQSQFKHERQIQYTPSLSIATVATHDQFFNATMKQLILSIHYYDLSLNFIAIIHPLTIKHCLSSSIIPNASSPALSFKPFSLILNHSNVGVVPSTITHVHLSNAESFISHSVLAVIQHAPTIRLIVQHIAFPSLSIITQIQHLIVFNSTHLLSIHSQQHTRVNIHFDHSIQTQFH